MQRDMAESVIRAQLAERDILTGEGSVEFIDPDADREATPIYEDMGVDGSSTHDCVGDVGVLDAEQHLNEVADPFPQHVHESLNGTHRSMQATVSFIVCICGSSAAPRT